MKHYRRNGRLSFIASSPFSPPKTVHMWVCMMSMRVCAIRKNSCHAFFVSLYAHVTIFIKRWNLLPLPLNLYWSIKCSICDILELLTLGSLKTFDSILCKAICHVRRPVTLRWDHYFERKPKVATWRPCERTSRFRIREQHLGSSSPPHRPAEFSWVRDPIQCHRVQKTHPVGPGQPTKLRGKK